MKLRFILLSVFLTFTALILIQAVRIFFAVKRMDYSAYKAFSQEGVVDPYKMIIMGDSTAVGVGSDPLTTTAGWFAKDYPKRRIVNVSQTGLRLAGLRLKMPDILLKDYDLSVIQIGANDIINMTPYSRISSDLRFVLEAAASNSEKVVILHSGRLGDAPIFTWPFNTILNMRAYKVREIYKQEAAKTGAVYVDLIANEANGNMKDEANKYYAPDGLHLTGEGYHIWYQAIRQALAG